VLQRVGVAHGLRWKWRRLQREWRRRRLQWKWRRRRLQWEWRLLQTGLLEEEGNQA
jgi:hypothetical protein